MGISVSYAIEIRVSPYLPWAFIDNGRLYGDNKPFANYLGTLYATDLIDVFKRKDNEKYPHDLSLEAKNKLLITDEEMIAADLRKRGIDYSRYTLSNIVEEPSYYAVAITLADLLEIPNEVVDKIHFKERIILLQRLNNGDPSNLRLIIEFD